jgi:hypothetical protein
MPLRYEIAVKYLALRGIVAYLNMLLGRNWRKSQDSRYLKGVWKGYLCRVTVVWFASKQRNIKYIPKLMGYPNNIGDIWNLLKTKKVSLLPETFRQDHAPTQPDARWFWRSVPVAKRSRREAKNSLPSITEFKNEWSYTSAPQIRLNGVDRDKCLFSTSIYAAIWKQRANCMRVEQNFSVDTRFVFDGHIWSIVLL